MCSATNIFLIDKLGLDCNDGSWLRRSYRRVVRHECTCSSIVFFPWRTVDPNFKVDEPYGRSTLCICSYDDWFDGYCDSRGLGGPTEVTNFLSWERGTTANNMPYRTDLLKYEKSVSPVLTRRDMVPTREVGHPGYPFLFAVEVPRVGHEWNGMIPYPKPLSFVSSVYTLSLLLGIS